MDEALAGLDPRLGVRLDGVHINHLAFADDVALLAETAAGLRALAESFEAKLASVGLRPNPKKSATLQILIDGKRKKWVNGTASIVDLDRTPVPALSVEQAYRYLGTSVTLGSQAQLSSKAKIERGLGNLSRAPLKPQQRLFMVMMQLLPSLHHELVLGDGVTYRYLKGLDLLVRKAVRAWLRLPHDTPVSLFYASADDGGTRPR